MLYHHPGSHVQNWGVSFDPEQLRTIREDIGEWDINAFLPPDTLEWCNGVLQSLGFESEAAARSLPIDRTAPYVDIYLELRRQVQSHIQNQFQPSLSLLAPPVGARNWRVCISYELF
jgi:hypothetical protein